MADIELVVKIDEEEYMLIKQKMQMDLGGVPSKAERVIADGTPLPKGHGRLVETNTIQSMAKKKAEDCFPEGRYYYGYRRALFDFVKDVDDIDDASIIIGEDKEVEDEKM